MKCTQTQLEPTRDRGIQTLSSYDETDRTLQIKEISPIKKQESRPNRVEKPTAATTNLGGTGFNFNYYDKNHQPAVNIGVNIQFDNLEPSLADVDPSRDKIKFTETPVNSMFEKRFQ